MTRKHFREIAALLRDGRADDLTIARFARWLATTNPRFNRTRFVEASTAEQRDNAPSLAPERKRA